MDRRAFLSAALAARQAAVPSSIVDSHIHLYDPTRPKGVPWPEKDSSIYRRILPADFRRTAAPFGVAAAVAVECSPWVEDNQWVLDLISTEPAILGLVGNIEPGTAEFPRLLSRFRRNPLFLGIRFGYLWGRDLSEALQKPATLDHLRLLARAGLTLDTAGPPKLARDLLIIADQAPGLRIVIDHLPGVEPPRQPAALAAWHTRLRELADRPGIFVKLSAVLRRAGDRVPLDAAFYRDRLDFICDTFGPDRLLFGSDWPNSEPLGSYQQVLGVVQSYFTARGQAPLEGFFWRNSQSAYRWKPRAAGQPR
ncbi:MAG: amidohydrolase family protein [Candidatus Solibacter usitatus]|nr:amidohydrolase family protein [Candidatus Solibacter usitatus]